MKKIFIYGLIGSLVVAGLLGIVALTIGGYNEISGRVLISTLAFALYSIIGLCCNSIIDGKYSVFGKIGLAVTFIGLLYAVLTTWSLFSSDIFLEVRAIFFVIGLSFAHCSLMLLIKANNLAISMVRAVAILASITAALIVVGIVIRWDGDETAIKMLGIVSIVGVVATIVAPILSFTTFKASQLDNESSANA